MGDCIGPVDSKEIRELIKQGIISRDTLIRKGSGGKWVPADHVKGLFAPPPPIVEQVPTAKQVETPTKKDCPFCAEEIAYAAIKCKHCGEFLGKSEATPIAAAQGKNPRQTPVHSPSYGKGKWVAMGLVMLFVAAVWSALPWARWNAAGGPETDAFYDWMRYGGVITGVVAMLVSLRMTFSGTSYWQIMSAPIEGGNDVAVRVVITLVLVCVVLMLVIFALSVLAGILGL